MFTYNNILYITFYFYNQFYGTILFKKLNESNSNYKFRLLNYNLDYIKTNNYYLIKLNNLISHINLIIFNKFKFFYIKLIKLKLKKLNIINYELYLYSINLNNLINYLNNYNYTIYLNNIYEYKLKLKYIKFKKYKQKIENI